MELNLLACPQCGAGHEESSESCASCGAHFTTPSDTSAGVHAGAIFGSYQLIEQIGEGGMGRVFIAEHTRLGRRVALKMLRSELAGNVEAVKRFFAEARAVNRIKHENIIEISDFIENEQGQSYCIMELLKGADLRTLEDREGVMPIERALDIAIQVCRGLAAAHGAGIVHRDLKPDNIFLIDRPQGEGRRDLVKLLDFGVAKLTSPSLVDASVFKTNAGIVVGTPLYMSPEQGAGKAVDHRTDIYALGVILFEMVTGQRPFHADSFGELLVKHMTTPPPRPSKLRHLHQVVPKALEELILSCMEKEASDRPQTMSDVERRLQKIALGYPSSGAPSVGSPPSHGSARRAWLGIGVAGLVVLGGLAAVATRHRAAQRPRAATARVAAQSARAPAPPSRRVEIGFESDPTGASVFIAGSSEPLGVTPFSSLFDATPRIAMFEFKAEGRVVGHRAVSLERDAHIEVALAPVAADAPSVPRKRGTPPVDPGPRPKTNRTDLDHDVVFNPFTK